MRQLRYFLALGETLHFRKAAELCNLTQSALSQQIMKLEEELGVLLVLRTQRSVSLTPAGRLLVKRGQKLLQSWERTQFEIKGLGSKQNSVLRIGYLEYQNLSALRRALSFMAKSHPDLEILTRNFTVDQSLEALHEGKIDLGIILLPVKSSQLMSTVIVRGQWCVLLPEDHELAKLARIPASRLGHEKIIIFARELNPKVHDMLVKAMRDGNSVAKVIQTTQSVNGVRLATERMGLYVVGSYVIDFIPKGLVLRPISEVPGKIEIAALWSRNAPNARAVREFVGYLKTEMKETT